MRTSLFSAMLGFIFILQLSSCEKNSRNVVKNYYDKGEFNGSVLAVNHGKTVCDTALGLSNLEKNIKMEKTTPIYIASLSKPFTAVSVMLLQQEGLLNYDDKASKYIELPAYAQNISIRQLLNHTSGIKDYESIIFSKKGLTNQDVLSWLNGLNQLEFPSGSKFEYSNSGFIILSLIIEKVSKQSYGNFLNEYIFVPLGMKNTWVYDSSTSHKNRATGYNKDKHLDDYSILTTGDGGIYSTPEDLFRFDQALRSFKLINKSNTDLMYTPAKLSDGKLSNYGFGWFIEESDGGKTVSHTGGLSGFRAIFWRDLNNNSSIIALTNQGDVFPLADFLKDMKRTLQ
ncbi:CubicO group peptidase, beta-lactamase class C family [Chryseobacterium oleae]|uniref:CubicO group peptidase, beta-lactamase class C family n=1 Tax=Chryseobacterium oleae TaxID=491207 RepID=A0A1I4VF83_CHROL|nr:serine hydrolase domain-containing protein [Chryseobacterium oleae]SFM99811.1 CubicO group peptidase, beta-lactamase class C family [Chryseobacterium oleae]